MVFRLRECLAKWAGQKVAIVTAACFLVLCACSSTTVAQNATNSSGAQPTHVRATATPTRPVSHYPPTTQVDLQWLGSQGDASAMQVSSTEMTGAVGACPEPRGEVIVNPSITGQQLAEGLLAFFYSQGYNTPCGSLILAYHSQNEVDTSDFYTAGRINLDTVDSSGQPNFDPNATGITYTLTLDVSGDLAGQGEYIITYTA